MDYKNILITGGAGFVGSNLAIKLKEHYPNINITVLDNLKRRGSELNLPRLAKFGINFIHGDVRNKEDLNFDKKMDLILECSAEPSVLAGIDNSQYSINTNLVGTLNCLELAKRNNSTLIFLSTSRIYPIEELNQIKYKESKTRFEIDNKQTLEGISSQGISEKFPLGKYRSLYGATKLCSEFLIQEYIHNFKIKAVINRCGIITGPWQMGKVDQGVIALWIARHIWKNKPLSYIGFGGKGKQVRDFIDIDDLFDVINIQIENIDKYNNEIFNIGGGQENSLSLLEMTELCQKITKNKINISSSLENRPDDIRTYISDSSKFKKISNWFCQKTKEQTFQEIYQWIIDNKNSLEKILN
ncbi:MAG: NAD-dependent epimerase/dehydratase family protein [Candidatus Shapirobacteria bacterium]|nr:NAD-dependent epimerase/dehydratase family protein [Candidatus Shapirobacteria bacterium]MDD4410537.1 NAD-dependent epimerase/dehydratase family protein [Candidatus Shapirobacteria bacterium]